MAVRRREPVGAGSVGHVVLPDRPAGLPPRLADPTSRRTPGSLSSADGPSPRYARGRVCREVWSAIADRYPEEPAVDDVVPFGLAVAALSIAGLLAVWSNRLSERIRVPAPAIFLVAAAVASDLVPRLGDVPGRHRAAGGHRDAGAAAVRRRDAHRSRPVPHRRRPGAAGSAWSAPCSPRPGSRRSATSCSGSTGGRRCCWASRWRRPTRPSCSRCSAAARSPAAPARCSRASPAPTTRSASPRWRRCSRSVRRVASAAVGRGVGEFALQMVVGRRGRGGSAAGCSRWRCSRMPLPSGALYPLQTLLGAGAIYGLATVAHGSGFLAVFVAGHPPRRPARAVQGGDRTLPLVAGEPRRDHRVRPARADRLAERPVLDRAWVSGLVAGRPAGAGGPAGAGRAAAAAGRPAPGRADVRDVVRAQGRRTDPARHLRPDRRACPTPSGSTRSSSSWSRSR